MSEPSALAKYTAAKEMKQQMDEVWAKRLASLRLEAAVGCEHPEDEVSKWRTGDEGYASDVIHEHETCKVCRFTREVYPRWTEWKPQ